MANPTTQEVLTHECRQSAVATTAGPRDWRNRHRRVRRELNRQGRWWGTLMRHYLLFGPVATLAFGVSATTAKAALVATAGSTHGLAASLIGTWPGAVAIATITVAADERGGVTAGAEVASSGEIHWQSRPMGNRRRRSLREILCRQRRRCWGCGARHRIWLGSWDRCRACVSTGQPAFYRIGSADATSCSASLAR